MNFVRAKYVDAIVSRAQRQIDDKNVALAWKLLEDAHIFSQPFPAQHLYVHWEMLKFAYRLKDYREVAGQLIRTLLAVPASTLGIYPEGNTGRCNVGLFEAMPVSTKNFTKMKELDKLEKMRRENGDRIEERQRQHPLTRR